MKIRTRFGLILIIIAVFTVSPFFLIDEAFSKNGLPQLYPHVSIKRITKDGGRVAWYHGDRHELIAFDAVTNPATKVTSIFTMQPDGSDRKCITNNPAIPDGFVGQPAWHPDGEHLLIQVENDNSKHTHYNHMSFGIDNDLWLIRRDGTKPECIYKTKPNHAALHPHFNADGTKLIFAERVPTGKPRLIWRRTAPGGENPWDGWHIHIADFDITKEGINKLSNHRTLFEERGGFYETHGFTKDGKITFSHTKRGRPYVDDIYSASIYGTDIERIIKSPKTWDEHGIFSPSGSAMAFNSSRADASWVAPRSKASTLTLELYLKITSGGKIWQLTDMNGTIDADKRCLTSDFDWDKDGRRIVLQVAPIDKDTGRFDSPEIWMLTFEEPQ